MINLLRVLLLTSYFIVGISSHRKFLTRVAQSLSYSLTQADVNMGAGLKAGSRGLLWNHFVFVFICLWGELWFLQILFQCCAFHNTRLQVLHIIVFHPQHYILESNSQFLNKLWEQNLILSAPTFLQNGFLLWIWNRAREDHWSLIQRSWSLDLDLKILI